MIVLLGLALMGLALAAGAYALTMRLDRRAQVGMVTHLLVIGALGFYLLATATTGEPDHEEPPIRDIIFINATPHP